MKWFSLYLWHDRHYFTATLFLYFTTFVVILPYMCKSWSYSKFFKGERNAKDLVKKALDLNDQRLIAADLYLSSVKSKDSKFHLEDFKKSTDVEIAIGIISISRRRHEKDHQSGRQGYLTQSAAVLHRQISSSNDRERKVAFICNVDADGGSHREAIALSRFLPTVQRFSNNTKNLSYIRTMDVFEKEKSDYSFCLEQALSVKPRYVLLLEDDVLVKDYLFATVEHLLTSYVTVSKSRQDEATGSPPWLFLKLYYPEKWQGYGNELPKIIELIAIGVVGGSIFAITFYVFSVTSITKSRDGYHWLRMAVFFSLGALYFVLVAIVIGRPYIHHMRGISLYTYRVIDAPDCCTQAILYPAQVVTALVNYLDTIHCKSTFPIDLAIDYFAMKRSLKRYLVEPNLVNHIGMISTVHSYAKSAADFIF